MYVNAPSPHMVHEIGVFVLSPCKKTSVCDIVDMPVPPCACDDVMDQNRLQMPSHEHCKKFSLSFVVLWTGALLLCANIMSYDILDVSNIIAILNRRVV